MSIEKYIGVNRNIHYNVGTIAERDLIPINSDSREIGTLCLVKDKGTGDPGAYMLVGGIDNINWVEHITLSGDVTGSGTTAISTTIAAQAVTLPKIQNVATATLLGRNTAGTGSLEVLTTIPTAVQNNITQVGTITSGVWTGTAIAVANGGTGATTAANARTNLGLGSFSTVSSNSIMTGYVQIGDDAAVPLEKHRTITGTTANSQGNQVFVTHGCPDPTKIISIRTFVDLGGGSNIYITSGYRYSTGYEFSERVSNTEIVISNVTGNSGNILNLPFKTLIIYRQ